MTRSAIAAWALTLLASSYAHASPSYPGALERAEELPCEPSCQLCHTSEKGGFATANTAFGITLRRSFGLTCCDDAELTRVVTELAAASVDSDGDGTPDLAELQQGSDPNQSAADAQLRCRPAGTTDGCTLNHQSKSYASALALLVLCAPLLVRRTRAAIERPT